MTAPSALTNASILITGGGGYIGSHFALHLKDLGIAYATLDSFERGRRDFVLAGDVLEADLRDVASLERAFAGRTFDTIFHFAAYAYVGESTRKPVDYYHNNVQGTDNLLRVGLRHGLRRIIFSSTCATYGNPVRTLDETHPQAPVNPYGWSKLVVEQLLAQYRTQHQLSVGLLRYFNAAGADSQGRLGEAHDPETHLIPLCLNAALGKGPELQLFGDDYPTPDGTCIRDYIHVEDLASAHRLVAEKLVAGPDAQACVYNLGTGRGTSVRELLDRVQQHVGRPVPHRISPRREGDPASLVASPDKARAELGWSARHDLDSILGTALAWHRRAG